MAESRSPLKDKPLRNPGQSVHEQRMDIVWDKALSKFLANEQAVMAEEDVKLAAYHLSRFIREQERVLEARK